MATRFEPLYPIIRANPAAYNPREIDDDARMALCDSIRTVGMVRPIVVSEAGVLLAGHQRCTALRTLGRETAPAFVVPLVGESEEVRFNQLHNGADLDIGGSPMRVPASDVGWREVSFKDITGEYTARAAARLNETCRLLAAHGPFSSAVATTDGEILVGDLYAHACRTLRVPLMVCIVPSSVREAVLQAFGRRYGVFSYAHLPRTSWVQSLAQPHRADESRIYELQVIPRLYPGIRILDIGAGEMASVRALRARGVHILGYEPFYRQKGKLVPNVVQKHIDAIIDDVRQYGLFDLTIADTVVNSCDSLQAERDVINTVYAFCKPSGDIIISSRSREYFDAFDNASRKSDADSRKIQFIDERGFSAMYSHGVWRYQRFHAVSEMWNIARTFDPDGEAFTVNGAVLKSGHDYGAVATGRRINTFPTDEVMESVRREFDLPLPGGRTLGRGNDMVALLRRLHP